MIETNGDELPMTLFGLPVRVSDDLPTPTVRFGPSLLALSENQDAQHDEAIAGFVERLRQHLALIDADPWDITAQPNKDIPGAVWIIGQTRPDGCPVFRVWTPLSLSLLDDLPDVALRSLMRSFMRLRDEEVARRKGKRERG